MAKAQIYGVSSKFNFGRWEHTVYHFYSMEAAEKWLQTEEYDFREREITTKTAAIKLAGRKAVENAVDVMKMYTPNEFIRRMENISHGKCTVDGEVWQLPDNPVPHCGFSADGLWMTLFHGNESITIRKKAVLKISTEKAVALFN